MYLEGNKLLDFLKKMAFVFSLPLGHAKVKNAIASFSFSHSDSASVEDVSILEHKVWGKCICKCLLTLPLSNVFKKKKENHSSLIIKGCMPEQAMSVTQEGKV